MGIGDWGLGIGDWGLGIGPNPQSPIPNPQSPIPNPHSIFPIFLNYLKYFLIIKYKITIYLKEKNPFQIILYKWIPVQALLIIKIL